MYRFKIETVRRDCSEEAIDTYCYNMVGAWPDTEVASIGGASPEDQLRVEHEDEGDECMITSSNKKLHGMPGCLTR